MMESVEHMTALTSVYEGWEGYQTSLVHAVTPLTREQLLWRPAADRRALGEIVRHVGLGRISWFARIGALGIDDIVARVPEWMTDADGARFVVENAVPADDARVLVDWLEWSWLPVQRVLAEWTVADLSTTYRHRWWGQDYVVSRQWTIWRVMAHDIHHGGQIAMALGIQGVEAFELRALGGHIVMPPLAAASSAATVPPLVVERSIEIRASPSRVWQVLTEPQWTRQWASEFGAAGPIESMWVPGSEVLWRNAAGEVYVNGVVVAADAGRRLRFTVRDVNHPDRRPTSGQPEDDITQSIS
jgi:uncharacterized damage-inducible protein DinB